METDEGRGGGKRWKNVLSVETDSEEEDEEREEIEKYESRWSMNETHSFTFTFCIWLNLYIHQSDKGFYNI